MGDSWMRSLCPASVRHLNRITIPRPSPVTDRTPQPVDVLCRIIERTMPSAASQKRFTALPRAHEAAQVVARR